MEMLYKMIEKLKSGFKKEILFNKKYRDLAPTEEIETSEYFEALDWALSNKKVSNVALSGPFGAGKSSIINSYLSQRKSLKPLRISLATFANIKPEKDEIAKGFLQQLFYKVDYSKIPQSRYRKLHKISVISVFIKLLLLFLLLMSVVFIFNNEKIERFCQMFTDVSSKYDVQIGWIYTMAVIVTILCLFAISLLCKGIMSKFGNAEINVVDKAKLSTGHEKEEYIFNKYLDEIIYFFEETKYSIIILEDMDRFEKPEIFINLREINVLLNNYELIKRHIIFLYAIKDDFFNTSTERTKFFDFIIPVIPYINATNSDDLLRRRLEEVRSTGLEIKISDDYITQVSSYISDMRVLTSIVNEFILYKNTLDKEELKLLDEQMLSLMIFKNLQPKAFADIETEKGEIKEAFAKKRKLINEKTEVLQKEIEELKEKIERADNDNLIDVAELKVSLLYQLSRQIGSVHSIQIDGKDYNTTQIMEPSFDMNILRNTKLTIRPLRFNGKVESAFVINNIDKDVSYKGESYIDRWECLKYIPAEEKKEAQNKIEQLKQEIYELKALKIKDIIERYGLDFLQGDKQGDKSIDNNKLLIFFLRNGYIDETYVNYINYFHEDSITVNEQSFILNIRNHGGVNDFESEIVHKSRVVERLVTHEFRQKEVLNFSLVQYLFSNFKGTEKFDELIGLLSSREPVVNEFIQRYLKKYAKESEDFIQILSAKNRYLWEDISTDEALSVEAKSEYLDMILCWTDMNSIIQMDSVTGGIVHFLEKNNNVLQKMTRCSNEKIQTVIHKLDVKFEDLDIAGISNNVINTIFGERKFMLNQHMIKQFVKYKKEELLPQLENSNYTVLLEINDKNILSYIEENYGDYMTQVFLVDKNNEESPEAIVLLCALADYEEGESKIIIDSQNTVFDDLNILLENVDDVKRIHYLIDYIIATNKLVISWDNIKKYYENYQITDQLFQTVQDNIECLSKMPDELNDDFIGELIQYEWDEECFNLFIDKYKMKEFTLSVSKISDTNFNILLEARYIPFKVEIYNDLCTVYPGLRLKYILCDVNAFLDSLEFMAIADIPLNEVVQAEELEDEEKLKLIQLIQPAEITIEMAMIIRNTEARVPKEYVQAAWDVLDEKNRYQLLLNHLEIFDNKELSIMFNELARDYKEFASRKRHKVTLFDTTFNRELIKKLERKRYITSSGVEEREVQVYTPVMSTEKRSYLYAWVKEVKND